MKKLALGLAIFSSVVFGISLRGMGKDNTGCGTFGACLSETLPSGGGNGEGGGSGGSSGGGGTLPPSTEPTPDNPVFPPGFWYVGETTSIAYMSENIKIPSQLKIENVDVSPVRGYLPNFKFSSVLSCKYPYVVRRVSYIEFDLYNLQTGKQEETIPVFSESGQYQGLLHYCPSYSNKIYSVDVDKDTFDISDSIYRVFADTQARTMNAERWGINDGRVIDVTYIMEGKVFDTNLSKCSIYFLRHFYRTYYSSYSSTRIYQNCEDRDEKYYYLVEGYPVYIGKSTANGKWYLITTDGGYLRRHELAYDEVNDKLVIRNTKNIDTFDMGYYDYLVWTNQSNYVCKAGGTGGRGQCIKFDGRLNVENKIDFPSFLVDKAVEAQGTMLSNKYCVYNIGVSFKRGFWGEDNYFRLDKLYIYAGNTFNGDCPNIRESSYNIKVLGINIVNDDIDKVYVVRRMLFEGREVYCFGYFKNKGQGKYDFYCDAFINYRKWLGFWNSNTLIFAGFWDGSEGYLFWSNPDFAKFYQKNVIR